MKLFLIHHRSPHHASKSGYGRLLAYLDAKVIYGTTKFPFRLAKIIAGFHSQAMGNYNVGSVLKTIELYKLLKKEKGQPSIVHFLNGERDIRYLGFLKKRFPNTRFVATFHKPPEVLKKIITNSTALQKLDGAIAVGANQVSFLKDWLQLENVVYIPHGVDTKFFCPNPSVKNKNSLLFVGQHLRDFKTFNTTIPEIATLLSQLKVTVVIHPSYAHKIDTHEQLNILTNVDDEMLRTLYQEASVLYLPMLDSTACNSILEAMACGLPIITSNVGGNAIYLKNTINLLIEPGNEEGYVQEATVVMQNLQRLCEMGVQSRKEALEMDWECVVNELQTFYSQCLLKN
ncbi:glycosyltransferase family 4 protein [Rasiella sp. SM2506]|uniref:glycosyltransferase family 4 protein n=1 Tax=Rasiella sp. SM2506 TaxID=3423914 RepID=UPI003D79202C